MEKVGDRQFGGVPERFKEEGVKVYGNELAKEGDVVEAQRDMQDSIATGERRKIAAIFTEPRSSGRGFDKEIELEGLPGKRFNPRRFKRVESGQSGIATTVNLENESQEKKKERFITLAKEVSESQESFPFPGIEPEELLKMRAADIEFPGFTTPVDTLLERFQIEGMRVILSDADRESGNVYIVPAGTSDTLREDKFIFPRKLQLNETMSEKIKALILADRNRFQPRP